MGLLRLLDRQKKFQGDLNIVQNTAVKAVMNQELEETVELEKMRAEVVALAGNQHTNPELLKHLFDKKQQEEENVEWVTPESEQDVQEILQEFNALSQKIPTQ